MPMTNKVMPIAKAISQRRICGSMKGGPFGGQSTKTGASDKPSWLAACCDRAVIEQKILRVVHKNFSGHVSVFLRAQVWLAEREYNSGNLTVHNGSLWCAQERTETWNVFEMTAAQTRGDTIHPRNLYAAEVRLTGADEYVLLRLNVSDEEIWLRLGRENFREPDRIPE